MAPGLCHEWDGGRVARTKGVRACARSAGYLCCHHLSIGREKHGNLRMGLLASVITAGSQSGVTRSRKPCGFLSKFGLATEHEVITEVTSSNGEIYGTKVSVASGFFAGLSHFTKYKMMYCRN